MTDHEEWPQKITIRRHCLVLCSQNVIFQLFLHIFPKMEIFKYTELHFNCTATIRQDTSFEIFQKNTSTNEGEN